MYRLFWKQFVRKNLSLILYIWGALTVSIFAFILSHGLSDYFLSNIEEDSRVTIGGDILVDLGNRPESDFDDFFEAFPYKSDVEVAITYEMRASMRIDDGVLPSTLIFHSDNYPFYSDFDTVSIDGDPNGPVVSQDFLQKYSSQKIGIFGSELLLSGYYLDLPKNISQFFSSDILFFPIDRFESFVENPSMTLVEVNYFFQILNPEKSDEIVAYIEAAEQFEGARIVTSDRGGDRFSEIVDNLKNYINYVVLFSLLLTGVIIFISMNSFFLTERRSVTILRVLGFKNTNLLIGIGVFFLLIILAASVSAMFLSVMSVYIANMFLIEDRLMISVIHYGYAFLLAVIMVFGSISIPVFRFVYAEVNAGFREDFFAKIGRKELFLLAIVISALFVVISFFLDYSFSRLLFGYIGLVIFTLVIYLIVLLIRCLSHVLMRRLPVNCFILFDSIRSTVKPGNLSFLLSLCFFSIFSIFLFVSIFFLGFYDRLKLNLGEDNNFFVVNLTEESKASLDERFLDDTFSVLRGRIISINDLALTDFLGDRTSGRYTREFNITDSPLTDLRRLSGEALSAGGVSVDDRFARDLGIGIGDTLDFQIYGITKTLTVQNIRESIEYSVQPFFYFQVNAEEFSKFPKNYFLSSYIEPENKESFKKEIFEISSGAASFIDVESILVEVKALSEQALFVILSLFLYIVFFCLLCVSLIILFFHQLQVRKSWLYTLIGVQKRQNRLRVFTEYAYIATMNIVISMMVVMTACFYLFGSESFIQISTQTYASALGLLLFLFIGFLAWIYVVTRD